MTESIWKASYRQAIIERDVALTRAEEATKLIRDLICLDRGCERWHYCGRDQGRLEPSEPERTDYFNAIEEAEAWLAKGTEGG